MAEACFGVGDAKEAISRDVQLARRFREFALPRWQADDEYQSLISNVLRSFPLRKPSLASPRALKSLLQVSDGVTANIVEILQEAAVAAIRSGQEFVNDELLEAVDLPHAAAQRYA